MELKIYPGILPRHTHNISLVIDEDRYAEAFAISATLDEKPYAEFALPRMVAKGARHYVSLFVRDAITEGELFDYLADVVADHYGLIAEETLEEVYEDDYQHMLGGFRRD